MCRAVPAHSMSFILAICHALLLEKTCCGRSVTGALQFWCQDYWAGTKLLVEVLNVKVSKVTPNSLCFLRKLMRMQHVLNQPDTQHQNAHLKFNLIISCTSFILHNFVCCKNTSPLHTLNRPVRLSLGMSLRFYAVIPSLSYLQWCFVSLSPMCTCFHLLYVVKHRRSILQDNN